MKLLGILAAMMFAIGMGSAISSSFLVGTTQNGYVLIQTEATSQDLNSTLNIVDSLTTTSLGVFGTSTVDTYSPTGNTSIRAGAQTAQFNDYQRQAYIDTMLTSKSAHIVVSAYNFNSGARDLGLTVQANQVASSTLYWLTDSRLNYDRYVPGEMRANPVNSGQPLSSLNVVGSIKVNAQGLGKTSITGTVVV